MSSDYGESNNPAPWKLEEIVSIIIVCIIFLTLSDCYGLFKRLLCEIFQGRNQVPRRFLDVTVLDDDPSLQVQSRGLEFCVVESLPTIEFKRNEGEQDKGSNVECVICLGEFEEGERLKHLPECSHSFHVSCIDKWFQSHSNCPLCRALVHHPMLHCSLDASHTLLQPLRREDFERENLPNTQQFLPP
ncbi:RING-H2 finger protein ATL66-like [Vigna radiata var. radiata]|uniref:RING-type E3 ubiquitin transferase n=1 Tax=Vigna radiata var. radiata TaxID=3916 RepID=A0A1S3VV08_VIGRR|nr:RING-H2 finger protein ATL66-like [Vigna radiata var. radiata]